MGLDCWSHEFIVVAGDFGGLGWWWLGFDEDGDDEMWVLLKDGDDEMWDLD